MIISNYYINVMNKYYNAIPTGDLNRQNRGKLLWGMGARGGEGGGWVKMSAITFNRRRKLKKKKDWLKRPKAVPIKWNVNQNINDSKSRICNSFFENIISGIKFNSHVPVDVIKGFFYSRFCCRKPRSQ